MAARAVAWLSWVVVPLALLGYALYLMLGLSGPRVSGLAAFSPDDAVWVLGQVVYAIVGAIVASRRPELSIGWLFCLAGLLGLMGGIAARAAVYTLADTSGSTGGGTVAWLSAALWYPNTALLVLGALLFPSGRPPTRGWWAVAWALGAGGALAAVGMGLLWPVRGIELLQGDPAPGSPHAPLGTDVMNVALIMLGRECRRHRCRSAGASPPGSGRGASAAQVAHLRRSRNGLRPAALASPGTRAQLFNGPSRPRGKPLSRPLEGWVSRSPSAWPYCVTACTTLIC